MRFGPGGLPGPPSRKPFRISTGKSWLVLKPVGMRIPQLQNRLQHPPNHCGRFSELLHFKGNVVAPLRVGLLVLHQVVAEASQMCHTPRPTLQTKRDTIRMSH